MVDLLNFLCGLFRLLFSLVLSLYLSNNPGRISSYAMIVGHILEARILLINSFTDLPGRYLTLVTTLPAPMVQPFPIVMPGKMITFPAIQQSSPIVMVPPNSGPLVPLRRSGSRGCVPLNKETLGPIRVRDPILTWQVSRMVQLKLMNTLLPTLILVP